MINILKLDHRPIRDKRITTHCALVSRAFKADNFYYSGIEDNVFEKNILSINKQWGGSFQVNHLKKPTEFVNKFQGIKIHLTMYGSKIISEINKIKTKIKKKDLLIIIGGPKVDRFYYNAVDYNISVTSQPHSEVAALAILLNYLNPECLLEDKFQNNKIKINPNKEGKKVTTLK